VPPESRHLEAIRQRLRARADGARSEGLQRFFKTGPGQYGEGDIFIGVTVPDIRAVCRECRDASPDHVAALLASPVHEERLLALFLMVETFRRGDDRIQREVYRRYLASTRYINNWDLVDASAAQIVGAYLWDKPRGPLTRLARSNSLWERRIAIIATHHFIKRDDFGDTFRVADMLLADTHDLIHKAVGWMLREVGKRDGRPLRDFLRPRYSRMPRTMLRYAIERFPDEERRGYLAGTL
jgi:3-methyladenine DNA glycosylase AlkD